MSERRFNEVDIGYTVGFSLASAYRTLNPNTTREEQMAFAHQYGIAVISALILEDKIGKLDA